MDGRKLSLNLKTLTGERSEETLMADNLLALPVKKRRVATPEKVSKWNYRDSIKSEIIQTDDTEIRMLIWANRMKTLNPLKIIPQKNGGPYAYQTKLG